MARVEDIIKMNKFYNERQKAVISIICASNIICSHHNEILGRYGLTMQQFNVLRILRGQFPHPSMISLIRERMMDKMSDASRIVERLRKADMVRRVRSEKDRRAVDVVITQKGLDVLSRIDKIEEQLHQPLRKLNEEESRQLSALIEKVFDSLD